MMRLASLLFLLCAAASAQMQILQVLAPGSEKPLSTDLAFGSVPMGESKSLTLRVRNTSQGTLSLTADCCRGTGFTMLGQPSFPHQLAPTFNMDVEIRFSPTAAGAYNGRFTVNGVSVVLTGSATPAAVLSYAGTRLAPKTSVDLGLAERGTTITKLFRIENPASETVHVRSANITGKYFAITAPLPLPMELAPGNAYEFAVAFAPLASGVFEGTIAVDDRTYRVTGTANEPPFPKPTILIDMPNPASGQQGKVSVKFGEASRSIGTGRLRMEFTAGTVADDAVRFTKGGNRLATFDVVEGTFTPLSEYTFQTGTTAGTIVFTAEVGGWTATANVVIPAEKILLDKTRAVKNASMLEIELTGYDNTRTADALAFTFYTSKGEAVQPGTIRVNGAADFKRYFETSSVGGVFTLKAVFPVAGPLTDIASVEVQLTNTKGATPSGKIQMQ